MDLYFRDIVQSGDCTQMFRKRLDQDYPGCDEGRHYRPVATDGLGEAKISIGGAQAGLE